MSHFPCISLHAADSLSSCEKNAIELFVDEVFKRTRLRLPNCSGSNAEVDYEIHLGNVCRLKSRMSDALAEELDKNGNTLPEGYNIYSDKRDSHVRIFVLGNDDRGTLFGVGKLLRSMRMTYDTITFPEEPAISSSPQFGMRGHQLGYRPKPNSYDGWNVATWEQYIRDLLVFGCNAIELIPPRSDDAHDSSHFPLPQMEMMVEMTKIAVKYGMYVSVWYPAMDEDYTDPATVEFALNEWKGVLSQLPRLDNIHVPCGDPGHTPPEHLIPMIARQAEQLKDIHPQCRWWISPTWLSSQQLETFISLVNESCDWLSGIMYGGMIRMKLPELRERIDDRLAFRTYPDITHIRLCSYPIAELDPAFALVYGREPICPRPRDMCDIAGLALSITDGSIAYSEGCNDDVNKAVWSSLGWNRQVDINEVLREYTRYFIGPEHEHAFTRGLLDLEESLHKPVLTNAKINVTFQQFRSMERNAHPHLMLNWRFLQPLYRAYADFYIRSRLLNETSLQQQAFDILRDVERSGSEIAIARAADILNGSITSPVAQDVRSRLFELGEALYHSIRMQMCVVKYQGQCGRSNSLDDIDFPFNSRLWLLQQFKQIASIDSESQRQKELLVLADWTNPGPGGFYDDLGNPLQQPHLVKGASTDTDPMGRETVVNEIYDKFMQMGNYATMYDPVPEVMSKYTDYNLAHVKPISWMTNTSTFDDYQVKLHYDELDTNVTYRLQVVYATGNLCAYTGEGMQIHGANIPTYEKLQFDIPAEATRSGRLTIIWKQPGNSFGPARGNCICEVWLKPVPAKERAA
ncbi:MAG: hypothetical protein GF398_06640 [Chitinivibrionales bacterium]|nr:hypothetical protein [Chitinivibrionales bacterium]